LIPNALIAADPLAFQASTLARQLAADAKVSAVSDLLNKSQRHLEEGVDLFASLSDAVNQVIARKHSLTFIRGGHFI
jgi:hypothetical protein